MNILFVLFYSVKRNYTTSYYSLFLDENHFNVVKLKIV